MCAKLELFPRSGGVCIEGSDLRTDPVLACHWTEKIRAPGTVSHCEVIRSDLRPKVLALLSSPARAHITLEINGATVPRTMLTLPGTGPCDRSRISVAFRSYRKNERGIRAM